MKIASNKISAIIRYFHEELQTLYPKEEIESFAFLCAEAYLGFTRADLVLKANDTVNESDLLKFSFAVKALQKNVPVQYVLGKTYFCELPFKVNTNVLIPRPETEELVYAITASIAARGFSQQGENKKSPVIVDIGTGSGCIAIALKVRHPAVTVYALDVSAEALEVARYNSIQNHAELHLVHADILTSQSYSVLPDGVDIIVSNPPYVRQSEKVYMQANVLDHEPHLALFVDDDDPLLFYKAIVELALVKLNKGGQLFFEINETLGDAVKQLLLHKGFSDVKVVEDINGKDRIVNGVLKSI